MTLFNSSRNLSHRQWPLVTRSGTSWVPGCPYRYPGGPVLQIYRKQKSFYFFLLLGIGTHACFQCNRKRAPGTENCLWATGMVSSVLGSSKKFSITADPVPGPCLVQREELTVLFSFSTDPSGIQSGGEQNYKKKGLSTYHLQMFGSLCVT